MNSRSFLPENKSIKKEKVALLLQNAAAYQLS